MAVGDEAAWDRATEALKRAAERAGQTYAVDPGGGAFYGPKIDIKVKDALGRPWQCTTVQFDFNLPERFDLTYILIRNRGGGCCQSRLRDITVTILDIPSPLGSAVFTSELLNPEGILATPTRTGPEILFLDLQP
jgi:hypothetical protein